MEYNKVLSGWDGIQHGDSGMEYSKAIVGWGSGWEYNQVILTVGSGCHPAG